MCSWRQKRCLGMSMSAHISTYTHLDKCVESRGKEDGRGNKDTYTFAKRIAYKGIQVYTNISTNTHVLRWFQYTYTHTESLMRHIIAQQKMKKGSFIFSLLMKSTGKLLSSRIIYLAPSDNPLYYQFAYGGQKNPCSDGLTEYSPIEQQIGYQATAVEFAYSLWDDEGHK